MLLCPKVGESGNRSLSDTLPTAGHSIRNGAPSSPGLPLSYSYLCGPFILCYTEVVQSAPGSSSGGIALYVGIDQMYPRGGDELKIFIGYLGQPPSYFF